MGVSFLEWQPMNWMHSQKRWTKSPAHTADRAPFRHEKQLDLQKQKGRPEVLFSIPEELPDFFPQVVR